MAEEQNELLTDEEIAQAIGTNHAIHGFEVEAVDFQRVAKAQLAKVQQKSRPELREKIAKRLAQTYSTDNQYPMGMPHYWEHLFPGYRQDYLNDAEQLMVSLALIPDNGQKIEEAKVRGLEAGKALERGSIAQQLSDAWDISAEDIDFVQEVKRIWQALKEEE